MSIDYIGIGLLALCLGALQVVLDKGQEDNWFYSPMIATLEVIFPVALVLFIAWELTRSKPVMDLRMFKNRNFAAAAAMIFSFGVQVYGMTVFTPQYVQAYMGYDAELAGKTQLPGALLLILLMPLAARLVRRIEARWLIGVGFLLSALASFYVTTNLDLQIDFQTAAMYRVLLSFGLALQFVPINTASYVGVPEEKGGEVSGTINLLRNIGGSVGISMVETMIARREQFHQDVLSRARDSRATGLSQHDERLERGPLSSRSQPASGCVSNYLAHLQLRHHPGQRAVVHRRGVAHRCDVPRDDSTYPDA